MPVIEARFKRNIHLVLSIVVLALSLLFAAGTFVTLLWTLDVDATSVGSIYLGNRVEKDYPALLETQVSQWSATAEYRVEYQGYEVLVDLTRFDFDADATIAGLVRDTDNPAVFTVSAAAESALLDALEATFGTTVIAAFDQESFLADLLDDMSRLYRIKNYRLGDYLDVAARETELAAVAIDGLPEADIDALVAAAGSLPIAATSRFSLLEALADADLENDQLSLLASGLQAATAATGFTAFLYRANPEMPVWGDVGRNVRILAVSGLDYSFFNPMDTPYRFALVKTDADTLTVFLYGYPDVAVIDVAWDKEADVPFPTEYVPDDTVGALTPGVIVIDTDEATIYRVLVRAGVDGEIWFCNRTTTAPGTIPVTTRIAIEEHPAIAAVYREHVEPKGGD